MSTNRPIFAMNTQLSLCIESTALRIITSLGNSGTKSNIKLTHSIFVPEHFDSHSSNIMILIHLLYQKSDLARPARPRPQRERRARSRASHRAQWGAETWFFTATLRWGWGQFFQIGLCINKIFVTTSPTPVHIELAPKSFLLQELNRVVVLTMARALQVNGLDQQSVTWVKDTLNGIMQKTPHR